MVKGSEFDIIKRHFLPLTGNDSAALGLADDAAVLDVPAGQKLVVTTDALVAGVHFLESLSAVDIAHKVVGVNLSDLAAMGAQPHAVFLAAQFPHGTSDDWIGAFAHGLGQALKGSGATLLGGDTVSTPGPMAFTLTALGLAPEGKVLTRGGAKPGDDVYVTGTIGDGALGLLCFTGVLGTDIFLQGRYARPQARFAFGHALAQRGLASACVDVSDGLAADIGHICESSNVGALINACNVPLSESVEACVKADASLMRVVLTGGDDYELAFTAAPENADAIAALASEKRLKITRIGVVQEGKGGVCVQDENEQALDLGQGGYIHL